MAVDVKMYGRVYQHITDAIQKHYGRYTLPWKYDSTRAAMVNAAIIEYKNNTAYPTLLHEALADVVLRWCWDEYRRTGKEDLMGIFHRLWNFQKKWLLIAENHTAEEIASPMDKEAADEISEICGDSNKDFNERTKYVTDLYVAVMESVILASKEDLADG